MTRKQQRRGLDEVFDRMLADLASAPSVPLPTPTGELRPIEEVFPVTEPITVAATYVIPLHGDPPYSSESFSLITNKHGFTARGMVWWRAALDVARGEAGESW